MTTPNSISSTGPTPDRRDLVAMVLFAVVVAATVWTLQAHADRRFLVDPVGNDVWFEGDQPTVADRMLHRWSDQSRNARHPLFPLLGSLPVHAFVAAGLPEPVALRLVVVAFAVLWSGTLYIFLLGVTRSRATAVIFAALGHVTAAALFWVPVPETYALGSVSVMAVLALCAWDPAGGLAAGWYVASAALSLAVTTTNWLTGLAGVATRHRWTRAVQIAANSLCVVVVLWGCQRALFPTADFFIGSGMQRRFILPRGLGGIPDVLRALFVHSIVMPRIGFVTEPKWGTIMSVQQARVGSTGLLGIASTVAWGGLLLVGFWTLARQPHHMRRPLAAALGGHVLVYALYGEETFLYTLLIAPLLIAVAAVGASGRLRPAVLATAALLTLMLAFHNWQQLARALDFFRIVAALPGPR